MNKAPYEFQQRERSRRSKTSPYLLKEKLLHVFYFLTVDQVAGNPIRKYSENKLSKLPSKFARWPDFFICFGSQLSHDKTLISLQHA